jgi:hypothetical protein
LKDTCAILDDPFRFEACKSGWQPRPPLVTPIRTSRSPTSRSRRSDGRLVGRVLADLTGAGDVEAILDRRKAKGLRLAEMLGNGPLVWDKE